MPPRSEVYGLPIKEDARAQGLGSLRRALVEAVTDGAAFLLDDEGRVIRWNPGARRTTEDPPDS